MPEQLLERYRLDEMDPRERRAFEHRLAGDPAAQKRLTVLDAEDAAILRKYPPHLIAVQVGERRADAAERRQVFPRRPVFALAGTLLGVCLVMLGVLSGGDGAGYDDSVRIKGDPQLIVYRRQADRPELLADGAAVEPHEELQIGYRAAGKGYGMIVSIDGSGATTLHYPPDPAAGTALLALERVLLPYAFQLDDAPYFERFFFITAERPLDVAQVMGAAERLAARGQSGLGSELELPDGYAQRSLVLKKVTGGKR
jgi:hypothetical protein